MNAGAARPPRPRPPAARPVGCWPGDPDDRPRRPGPAPYTALVVARLDLAALTAEELERLLGSGPAQKLLPDLSAARMAQRAYAGPEVALDLQFEPLAGSGWGATAEHARALRTLQQGVLGLGYTELGALYLPGVLEARHHLAFVGEGQVALALRWSESPEHQAADHPAAGPFLQALSLLRDRASGVAAVLTSTAATQAPVPFAPALSEEVDGACLPGAGAAEALAAHQGRVARHGRAVKIQTLQDWTRAWQVLRGLNLTAWTRRGVLLTEETK